MMDKFDDLAQSFRAEATTWPPRDEVIADLLRQVARQAAERMRDRCAAVAESYMPLEPGPEGEGIAAAIRSLPLEDDNG